MRELRMDHQPRRPAARQQDNGTAAASSGDDVLSQADGVLRLSLLIDHLPVGVLLHNRATEILLCNRAAADLLRTTREQLAGKTLTDFDWNAIHEHGEPFPVDRHPVPDALRSRQHI